MILVLTFLNIEARRFRFFDVWRARVRMLEENFVGPILRRDLASPTSAWGRLVAEDLLHPRFKLTYHQALRARLQRNYLIIFCILLMCWIIKLIMHPRNAENPTLMDSMCIGPIPGWVSLLVVSLVYGYLLGVFLVAPRSRSPQEEYWGDKDHRQEELSRIDI